MNEQDDFDVARSIQRVTRDRYSAWQFIQGFTETWQALLLSGDGNDEEQIAFAELRLGVRLPAALREAYELLGRRTDLTSNQDRLLQPEALRLDPSGEVLVFRLENQNNARWGIRLKESTQDDPPVLFENLAGRGGGWRPWLPTTSLAIVEIILSETMFGRGVEVTDNAPLDADSAALVERSYRHMDFPEYPAWTDPDGLGVRWFYGSKAVLREDSREWLWVLALRPADLAEVKAALPLDWLGG